MTYLTPFQLLTDPGLLPLGPNRVIWTNLDTRRSGFAAQLFSPAQASNSTYNAYTFYRLLGSLGTDASELLETTLPLSHHRLAFLLPAAAGVLVPALPRRKAVESIWKT